MEITKLSVNIGGDIKDLQAALRQAKKELQDFGKEGKKSGDDTDKGLTKAAEAATRTAHTLKVVGGMAENAGRALTLGVTAPLLAVGAGALKISMDYEQSMNVLQAASKATAGQMGQVDALARQLGNDLTLPSTSAKDAAEAMLAMSKMGIKLQDAMAGAKGVLQMSAAAQISNAEAADITAKALNAFHLQGSQAVRVADLLAASSKSGAGTIIQMAEALQQSSASFAMAKVPINDAVTAIAMMGRAGIQGSDAGTSLKTMLARLTPETDKAAKALQAVGVNAYDAKGAMLPLREIVGQFQAGLAGLSQQQRTAALQTIFGSDAIRAANVVLGEGVTAWDKQRKASTEGGAAAAMAGAQNKGLKGALDGLKSALETAALAAMPYLQRLAEGVRVAAEWVTKLSDLPQPAKDALLALGLLAAAAGPLLLVFGNLASAAGFLIANWAAISTAGAALAAVLTGPVGIAVGVAVAAVAGLALAWKSNWGGIREATGAALAWIKSNMGQTWATVRGDFAAAWGALKIVVVAVFDVLKRLFAGTGQDLAAIFRGAWMVIAGVVKVATGLIMGILATFVKLFTGDWKGAWESVKQHAKLVWDGILDIVAGAITMLLGALRGAARTLFNLGREAIAGFLSGFRNGTPEAEDAGRRAGQAAVIGARRGLDAHSPSRLFHQLGLDAAHGLANGLAAGRAVVASAAGLLAAAAEKAFGGALPDAREWEALQHLAGPLGAAHLRLAEATAATDAEIVAVRELRKAFADLTPVEREAVDEIVRLNHAAAVTLSLKGLGAGIAAGSAALAESAAGTVDSARASARPSVRMNTDFTSMGNLGGGIASIAGTVSRRQENYDRMAESVRGALDNAFQGFFANVAGDLGGLMKNVVQGNLGGIIGGLKNAAVDFFQSIGNSILNTVTDRLAAMATDWAMQLLLGGATGGGGGLLGKLLGFAGGGDVPVNQPVWVGEHGREIFMTRTPGTIIPNGPAEAMAAGGGRSVVVNQTFNIRTPDAASFRRSQQHIEQDQARALRRSLERG